MRDLVLSSHYPSFLRLAIGLTLLAPATAQSFNVDVGDTTMPVPSGTYAAAANQPGTWNAVDLNGSPGLMDLTGATTAVGLQTTGGVLFSFDHTGTSGDDEALLDDLQDLGGLGSTELWTFLGIENGTYQVFTYAWAPDNPGYRTDVSVAGAVEGVQTIGGTWTGSHVQLVTYALHTVDVTNNQIDITVVTSNSFGSVNGIQLVRMDGGDDLGTKYCTATPNSTGAPAAISATGSASIAANDLVLHAMPVPNQNGLFFYGANQIQLAFGNGFRCVGGQLFRLPVQLASGNQLSTAVDYTSPPSAAGQITAGSTWNFQAWFRDPAGGGSFFNLSNGLEITFTP